MNCLLVSNLSLVKQRKRIVFVRGRYYSAVGIYFVSHWLRRVDSNHWPLGYEPNELTYCSTPQYLNLNHWSLTNRCRWRICLRTAYLPSSHSLADDSLYPILTYIFISKYFTRFSFCSRSLDSNQTATLPAACCPYTIFALILWVVERCPPHGRHMSESVFSFIL